MFEKGCIIMQFSEETLAYLEAFLDETREQLQSLEKMLVSLESNPCDHDCLDNIFRIAHTLKGNAATMGFEEMTNLAHHMESLLDAVRKGMVRPSGEITDILLTSLDVLHAMADTVCGKGRFQFDLTGLIAKMEELTDKHSGPDMLGERMAGGKNKYRVAVCLDENCVMRAARAFIIAKRFNETGEIIELKPSMEFIQKLDFNGTELEAVFVTNMSQENLIEMINNIPEVKTVRVLQDGNGAAQVEKPKKPIIKAGARFDVREAAKYMGKVCSTGLIVDLSEISELSPRELYYLLQLRDFNGTEVVLPRDLMYRRFFELLGFVQTPDAMP